MTPCKRPDEVRSRAIRFIRLEEDKEIQRKSSAQTSYDHPNCKTDSSSSQRSFKAKPILSQILIGLILLKRKRMKRNSLKLLTTASL